MNYPPRRIRLSSNYRRPFWLPASNYYFLASGIAIAFFFLLWGILHDGQEEKPWIGAGLGASVILILAVVVREVILRNARRRFVLNQRRLEEGLKLPILKRDVSRDPPKVTIERNEALIKHIRQKSDAANVLTQLSPAHKEVFELCEQYLQLIDHEIPGVGIGSPRLPVLRRGSESVRKLHRFHLLKWAELESRALIREGRSHSVFSKKVESAQKALGCVEFAAHYYPSEKSLLESSSVLKEMIATAKVDDLIEKADRADFKGHSKRAASLRQDALFLITRLDFSSSELDARFERIRTQIGTYGGGAVGNDQK
jgi:hypothetical protein